MFSLSSVSANNQTISENNTLSSIDNTLLEIHNYDLENDSYDNLNIEKPGKIIEITQDNYENYFDIRTGNILENSNINKGDTLKIGNISNRAFVIDRQLTLMPITPNDQIRDGFIHLVKGSDGSTITNLTINNTKSTLTIRGVTVGQLHGIWLSNSNNNLISYNTIRIANSAGVYAMPMGWSSYNRIIGNDMKTYITTNIIMGECHYNLISNNSLEVLSYSEYSVTNLIYFNPFGHADFHGSALCKGNVISYNYLKGFCTMPMSIILQFEYANHEGTIVANNTIIKGSFGINVNGNNVSVYGNTVQNSATGISVSGSNFSVFNNTVSGNSQQTGIRAEGSKNSRNVIFNNNVTFTDVSIGISLGNNIEAYNNNINIKNYGIGIFLTNSSSTVHDNTIKNNHDDGISILGNNNTVKENIVTTHAIGISIPAASTKQRYYNNSIIDNKITSERYGISIEGLVYNSVIKGNVIETNSSEGIHIDITDELSNTELDNIVNGVILKSSAVIINDDNFNQYFDENGYFNYKLIENQSSVIFLTFLTNKNIIFNDKITVISNKMDNLLFNVTVTFEGDAEGSIIGDFNFINYDKEAIIINNIDDITITRNNITTILRRGSKTNSAILIQGLCNNEIISHNNIYVNSKTDFSYAITAPAMNPSNRIINTDFSKAFTINDNTIIMISTNMAEAIYTDSIIDSEFYNNKINIMANGYGYGLAFANLIGKLSNNKITNNEIIINTDQMAYLIEFHMVENSTIANNTLYGNGNGVFGVGIFSSDNISVENNSISIFGGDLNKIKYINDVLGIGNSAISVIKFSDNITIKNNLIITNTSNPISKINVTNENGINISSNSYVVSNDNFNVYFKKNELILGNVEEDGRLLLYNITNGQKMIIKSPIIISSYKNSIINNVSLVLNKANNVTICDIVFIDSTIELKSSSNIIIANNTFNSTRSTLLTINNGKNNTFSNNSISINSADVSVIKLTKTDSNIIQNNVLNINGTTIKAIIIDSSKYNLIEGNVILAEGEDIIFINAIKSTYDNITQNILKGNGSSIYGYYASKANYGYIGENTIEIEGFGNITNQSGIYYTGSSMRNNIINNHIESFSKNADDYAVMIINTRNSYNNVINNYLISSNGSRRSNEAVYAKYDVVKDNTPIDVYVSMNGSDETGDGSIYNPYASITKAISNSLDHSTIYVSSGYYNESNINITRNVTIWGYGGNVIIDAESKQLFNISRNGILSISRITIQNAHNVEGGSAFINNGKLYISNSAICNSSSYYDNSHPIFDHNTTFDSYGEMESGCTLDCSELGKGGAILNNGELFIDNSVFYNNLGHIGGAIADYGKLNIESSIFYNNSGVHGGVIYTDSENEMTIRNSAFSNNIALTSLDYCTIKISASSWSIENGIGYVYNSICDNPSGEGGVIYTKNTRISLDNSIFVNNSAKCGGVIATKIDSFSSAPTFDPIVDLKINNCTFINNKAKDTRQTLGSIDLDNYRYYNGFNGGVIYGTYNKLYITNSEFYYNQAGDNGGVMHAKSNDGKILDSIFELNTAGISGGALDISKNIVIERSIISNNSARYGGAIEYNSYEYYNHVQNNFNIYNSTISNNRALNGGGAFNIGYANITVRDSNIVDNVAPNGNTFTSRVIGGQQDIDMRYNYWGSNGPDDSVWKAMNRDNFYPITREWIDWNPKSVDVEPSPEIIEVETDDDSKGSGGTGNTPSINYNPGTTGTSTSTGRTIGGNGNNDGNRYFDGDGIGGNHGNSNSGGSGDGTGISGDGITNLFTHIPGNSYDGQKVTGNYDPNASPAESNTNSKVNGTVNSNSESKVNSSNYDDKLSSIGMKSNAAAMSSSSSGNPGESSSSQNSGESGSKSISKSYEITEKLDEIIKDDDSMIKFIILAFIVISLLIIGYKRKEKETEE